MVFLGVVFLLGSLICGAWTQTPPPIGSLATTLGSIAAADLNGDGQMSKSEIQADLSNNFDTDRDGCVNQTEWINRFTAINFTREYASSAFSSIIVRGGGIQDGCLGLKTTAGRPMPLSAFLSEVVSDLVAMCERDTSLYISNSDCNQVPRLCGLPPYGCLYACHKFSLYTTRQQLATTDAIPILSQYYLSRSLVFSIDRLVSTNDPDGDGMANATELTNAYKARDYNEDGCVDKVEFTARYVFLRCGGMGLPQEMGEQRFNEIMGRAGGTSPSCNGIATNSFTQGLPIKDAVNSQLNTLLTVCEADRTRYETIKSCGQLLDFCVYSKYQDYETCKGYVNGVIRGIYGSKF